MIWREGSRIWLPLITRREKRERKHALISLSSASTLSPPDLVSSILGWGSVAIAVVGGCVGVAVVV